MMILISATLGIAYSIYYLINNCSTDKKFSKRHKISVVHAENVNFAVCSKCGGRWPIDGVDEMIFLKRKGNKVG